jgi:hypothetical protein
MLRYYYFRARFNKWFQNKNGIKGFAEQSLAWFIKNATKSSQAISSKINMLKDRKSKLITRLEELATLPLLDGDEFFSVRKKIRFQQFIIPTIIVIEIFLNYISTLVFITGDGILFTIIRWGIALILTLAGVLITDKLLETILPNKPKNRLKSKHTKPDVQILDDKSNRNKTTIKIVFLSILLIMTEITIIGVSEARARDIEGGNTGGILYYGFILLSMALPLIAGFLRWDMFLDYDVYKNTLEYNSTKEAIRRTDQLTIALKAKEEYFLKSGVMREWQILSEFKNYKEVYNQRLSPPIEEDIYDHFCSDRDAFIEEATNEYYKTTANIDSSSKLEIARNKLGSQPLLIDDSDINI